MGIPKLLNSKEPWLEMIQTVPQEQIVQSDCWAGTKETKTNIGAVRDRKMRE